MAQTVKALAAEADNLSSILRTHRVEEEKLLHSLNLSSVSHKACSVMNIYTHITHKYIRHAIT